MPTLKADNRSLLVNAKFSYLTSNYASGASSVNVLNGSNYAANQYALFANFGSSSSEILKIKAVSTNTLTFKNEAGGDINIGFAHPESTRVYILPYNQVKFYHTATTTFGTGTLLATSNVLANEYFTSYEDTANSTGYGWFVFYNQASTLTSTNSNYIPYTGFVGSTVKSILDDFFSLLNNKELKQVSLTEAYSWMNEGYALAQNALNLISTEYKASSEQTLAIVAGTDEYALPSDFARLIYIRPSDNSIDAQSLEPISLVDIPKYLITGSPVPRYYLRGLYLGIVPTPAQSTTYYYRYQAQPAVLDSYEDIIDLPNNGHHAIKDFMCFRVYQKLTNPNSSVFYKAFQKYLDDIKMSAITRDRHPDSFGIAPWANV
jgi:hypothetical protein